MPKAAQAFTTPRRAWASSMPTPPDDAELIAVCDHAVRADAAYHATADFSEDHPALASIDAEHKAALHRAIALPASTLAGLAAKARALDTCIVKAVDGVSPAEGDVGEQLMASLIGDILRMDGGSK